MDEKESLHKLLEISDEEVSLTPKQAKIIESAVSLFAEKGYASTSTSEIAKKAGVSEGTIFRHYPTKKDLLLSIVKPIIIKFALPFFMTKFSKEVFKTPPDSYEELLHKVMDNRFEFVKQNQVLLKIFLQELAFHPELKEAVYEMAQKILLPKLKNLIESYKQRRQLADYPVDSIIRLSITNLLGFLVTRFIIFPDHSWDDEAEKERTIRFLMKGLAPE